MRSATPAISSSGRTPWARSSSSRCTPWSRRAPRPSAVDVIIAQGGEAGGFGSTVGTLALVRRSLRGRAPSRARGRRHRRRPRTGAALILGAQASTSATRSSPRPRPRSTSPWKRRIAAASSEDAVKVDFADAVFPPTPATATRSRRGFCTRRSSTSGPRPRRGQRNPDPLRAEFADRDGGRPRPRAFSPSWARARG